MRKKKSHKFLKFIIFLVILFLAVPVGLDLFGVPVSKNKSETVITIEDGTSSFGIGSILKDNDLIRSKLAFFAKVKTGKYNGKLGSGTFTLSPDMSVNEICEIISKPKPVMETVTVTFPEGYSVEQMAQVLEENGLVSAKSFLEATGEPYNFDFLKNIPDKDYNYKLQGFLFPDTYEFYRETTAREIIEKMLSRFEEIYRSLDGDNHGAFEIITKASMIEKEAKVESERPVIAGVIENRTKLDMAYQIDATVLYDATEGLYNQDESSYIAKNIRELNSPYNTYKYSGLPAGPICNPGITSIKAALNPAEHEYLYYHTDTQKNDGTHIFSKTMSEHVSTLQ